ncbi:Ig-like domain-containing protein [Planomicrobium okeanokoites]|uniref:Ig-like domain-containing protein n=1 Tax=Planomicrobium okeanokoites TaxID=244 RepID=UPI0030F4CF4C
MGKKALKWLAVLLIFALSGVLTTISAIAAELVVSPEFGATPDGVLVVKQGETKDFMLNLSYQDGNQKNTEGKIKIDSLYRLAGNEIISSQPKEVGFSGIDFTAQVKATFNAEDSIPGEYKLSVNVLIENKGNGKGNELVNSTADSFIVKVIASDTTAPEVLITNPIDGGFYQSADLPELPEYTVNDESSTESSVIGWSKEEGTHTVTVFASDTHDNKGSVSVSYTVDDSPPVISSQLEEGGVYNTEALKELANDYYGISENHLESFSADQLSLEPGEHTVRITAKDKAGNVSEKSISYIVDNDAPAILFNFIDGAYYSSINFKAFNPYFEVWDSNLDENSISSSEAVLTEGTHSVTVTAADQAGNTNSASADYTIDDTKPAVAIHLVEGGYYNEAALTAAGEFYTVSDLNLLSKEASGFGTKDGSYTASVTATDKAGNETVETVNYIVDTEDPAIIIDAEKLANGGFYQSAYLGSLSDFYIIEDENLDEGATAVSSFETENGTYTFSISASDKAGNKSVATVSYTLDDIAPEINFNVEEGAFYKSSNLPETYFSAKDNNGVVSIVTADDYAAAEGTHSLTVTVMDAAGNSTTRTVSYTVDDTAPAVSISAPADGGFYNSADLPEKPVFEVEEIHAYTTNTIGWNKETEGEHAAVVSATDAAGNIGSASVTYIVDNTSPAITSTLLDGGYYNAETLQSLGKYYEVADLNLEEEKVTASELVFTEGPQKAVVTAVDKAGNTSEKTIHYTVDNTKPTISFLFNDGGFYTSEKFSSFDPYYSISDDNLAEDTVNVSEVIMAEGQNDLTVNAADLAGNSNSATASYTIDDTAPKVSVSLQEGAYYNLESLEALGQYWTADDVNLAAVVAEPLASTDGTHTATVTAVDKAGNTTVLSVEYHVDNTPPAIEIDESKLKNGGYYTAEYLQGLADKPYSVIDANPASDSASNFEFEEGTHEYTVTAIDKAGNAVSTAISYTVDNTAPEIEMLLNENGIYTTEALKAVGQYYSVSDNSGKDLNVEADALAIGEDGTYTMTVTATDLAGNNSSASVTYTVDDTNPEVVFHLADGKHYTSESLKAALSSFDDYYAAADRHLTAVDADPLMTDEGQHNLTVVATDAAGNKTEASISYVVDNTAPSISGLQGLFDGQRFLKGQDVGVVPVVTDNFDDSITVETVKLDTSQTGKQTVSVTATDQAGNSSAYSMTYYVYDFSGVLQPVKADGKSVFQKNRTVPVKFQVFDGSTYVQDAVATIHLVKVSDTFDEGEIQVTSTSGASIGNEFRYDSMDEQYIFNLGTKDLEKVQYKAIITITLDGNKIRKESPAFSIK